MREEQFSFTIGRALIFGQEEAHLGDVTLPLTDRLHFLFSGRVSIYQTTGGGSRISLHTPRLRSWLHRKLRGDT